MSDWLLKNLLITSVLLFLVGCQLERVGTPAPVEIASWRQMRPNEYLVKPGDTLYSVAWIYGMDYRELARLNKVMAPYALHPGQMLHLRLAKQASVAAKVQAAARSFAKVEHPAPSWHPVQHRQPSVQKLPKPLAKGRWYWPINGPVRKPFSLHYPGNAGIDIAAHLGATVHAAAPGQVVYSGHGVKGYGNLLIVKNSNTILSAYAYNRALLVQVGDRVRLGQKIAEAGAGSDGKPVLHFEVRRYGRPVDPMHYLKHRG